MSIVPLRPPEFEISDPTSPFGDDLLGRKPRIEALSQLIRNEEGPAVISVNGGFGSGKSAFLKMLAANLRLQDGIEVQEFNAWQQAHTTDPLIDIVAALTYGHQDREPLMQIVRKFGWRVVKGVAGSTLSAVSGGVIDLTDLEGGDQATVADPFAVWSSTEQHIAEFTDGLRAVVQKGQDADSGPAKLTIIVDELDRCRPDYAIDMLNIIRHLFAIAGVVIVVGMNRKELEHRVTEVFGPETDADVYLRRFVDFPVHLESPEDVRLSDFVRHQVQFAGVANSNYASALQQALEMLLKLPGTHVRDVQQLARAAAPASPARPSHQAITEVAVVTLIVLRHMAASVYGDFVSDRCDAFAVVAALRSRLALGDRLAVEFGGTLEWMERVVWQMGDSDGRCAIERPDFTEAYVKANLGDAEQAATILQQGLYSHTGFRGYHLRTRAIANLIELAT